MVYALFRTFVNSDAFWGTLFTLKICLGNSQALLETVSSRPIVEEPHDYVQMYLFTVRPLPPLAGVSKCVYTTYCIHTTLVVPYYTIQYSIQRKHNSTQSRSVNHSRQHTVGTSYQDLCSILQSLCMDTVCTVYCIHQACFTTAHCMHSMHTILYTLGLFQTERASCAMSSVCDFNVIMT